MSGGPLVDHAPVAVRRSPVASDADLPGRDVRLRCPVWLVSREPPGGADEVGPRIAGAGSAA